MKKEKIRLLLILILLGLAVVFTGCTLPDYQLAFEITNVSISGDTATVSYQLENTGVENLKNATIKITVENTLGTLFSGWTTQTDISVGDDHTGTLSITFDGTYSSAIITAAAWDTDDNSVWWQ